VKSFQKTWQKPLIILLVCMLVWFSSIAIRPANVTLTPTSPFEASNVLALSFEGDLTDSSGRRHHGTFIGTNYAFVEGVGGGLAVELRGETAIDLGTSGELQPADLTLSFWLKPNGKMEGEQMIAWHKSTFNGDGWYVSSEGNQTPLAVSIGSAERQPYKVSIKGDMDAREKFFPENTWTHIVVTYDSSKKEVKIYRNGIEQETTVSYENQEGIIRADDTSQKAIGYNGPNYGYMYAKFALDEYRLYSTVASYEDVKHLHEREFKTEGGIPLLDLNSITLPLIVTRSLDLPTVGEHGSAITWSSSDESVISPTGEVKRPEIGEEDAIVILTATAVYQSETAVRRFELIVAARVLSDTLQDVAMHQVVLTDPYYVNAFEKEVAYLLSLEPDKLLSGFRSTAGLQPKASMYGGWESTEIRGHTLGHYLSAISMAYQNATGDVKRELKSRIDYIVDELALVQAEHGNGYVSAFPEEFLDRVERGQAVWVPWYTMHKILAGLISAAQFGGSEKALQVAEGLGEYVYNRTSKWDAAMKARVLSVEYGGMNDALYDLYILTGNSIYLRAAEKFDELTLFDQLYRNIDVLNGKHANTMIPKIIGALKRYIALGEEESEQYYLIVAQNFWQMVVDHHTYVTGGNSENEHFGMPGILDAERTNVNNETCNVYNMLKLTRELYKITKDKKYADFYENAYTNAIMASQNPETGMTMYFQPMATGFFKVFGSAFLHFWCCTGTGMENFSKLNDSIYFRHRNSLYVNMYLSSIVTLDDLNLKLTVKSHLPNTGAGDASSGLVEVTVNTTGPSDAELRFRIPDWAPELPAVSVNGERLDGYAVQGGYIVLKQEWEDGTKITLDFPMEIVIHALPDNPNSVAFKYGPVVLSAGLGTNNMTTSSHGVNVLKPNPDPGVRQTVFILDGDIEGWKARVKEHVVKADGKLAFTLRGTDADEELVFTPHFQRYLDRYGIYFELVTADSESYQRSILAAKERGRLESSTISFVIVANDQYELAANRQTSNSYTGTHNGKMYRDARSGGYFSYDMEVRPGETNRMAVIYYSGDQGRTFDIYVDDVKLVTEVIENRNPGDFYVQMHELPQTVVDGSRTKKVRETDERGNTVEREIHYVTIRFQSTGGFAGGIFDILRIVGEYRKNAHLSGLTFDKGELSEPFDPDVTEYTLTVPRGTGTVRMKATPADEHGLVYVGNILINDHEPRAVKLPDDGVTELVITAKAEDHVTEKVYRIWIVEADEEDGNEDGGGGDEENGDGSGGGDDAAETGNDPAPSDETEDDAGKYTDAFVDHEGTIRADVAADDGRAAVKLNPDAVREALARLKDRVLNIVVHSMEEADGYLVDIPLESLLNDAEESKFDLLRIDVGMAVISIQRQLLIEQMQTDSMKTLRILVRRVDVTELPEYARSELQNAVVYDLTLEIDGVAITDVAGNVQVALAYELKPGESAGNVVVYHIGDREAIVVKHGRYDPRSGKVLFRPSHLSLYAAAHINISFSDVLDGWAKPSIEALAARGIVDGVGSGRFDPSGKVTRAQFLHMLMKAFDLTDQGAVSTFRDVNRDAWYYETVASAQALGIVRGRPDGTFGPNDEITRQDMAVMAYAAAKHLRLDLDRGILVSFNDAASISEYAVDAVNALRSAGVMGGVGDGRFAPHAAASRAEAAAVIDRLLRLM